MKLREPFPPGMNIQQPKQGLLRVAVLGPPEVIHDGSRLAFSLRKAQALLLYLAVEKGLHPRSKLIGLLWPDSEPHTARSALRNALTLLHSLLDAPPVAHCPLLIRQDALGLNPQAPLELDLEVVQRAWKEALRLSTVPAEPQRTALVAQVQHALSLVRGPFLEGFWLREEAPFDGWVQQQQQQWQVRLLLLCDRLSNWQEAAGELEQARTALVRWLALDPLSEEASRRLMRVDLAQGEAAAALQVYATCRARLAEELQIEPSADTLALAEHIRITAARRPGSRSAHPTGAESQPPSDLIAPLVGRTSAFTRLISCYQQSRLGQPQTALLVGEVGIGKTRLANEFVAWAQAQGAEVLSGHALELGGRLPYQPLVEALRPRLEEENAPEDLLDDLWLAELARLLPELRLRYPDLPTPIMDDLTGRLRLFEAVARLLEALTERAPLVLLLDDLHCVDGVSLDLVRYLAHFWKEHGSRVLLLGTVRRDQLELTPALSARLADLRRDLPITQVALQPLSQQETLQLVEALVEEEPACRSEGEWVAAEVAPGKAGSAPGWGARLWALGDWLFAHTGGQPLYLLETLKLFRDREWLVPRLGVDGIWRLELVVEMATIVAQKRSGRELVPPSVRAMILARLSKLTQPARQLVMASAVLGSRVSAQLLWQVAELGVQVGIEALEEAIKSGMLREEAAEGPEAGRLGDYSISYELMREVVYAELGAARRQVLHQRAISLAVEHIVLNVLSKDPQQRFAQVMGAPLSPPSTPGQTTQPL
jgi:DNA-binding SARP family transcriptional activator